MEDIQITWTPSEAEIELLRIYAVKSDEAMAEFKAKVLQVAVSLGVDPEEFESGEVVFDWKSFRPKPKEDAK